MTRELEISVNDRLLGHLRENNGLWELQYATEWTSAADAFDLAPALPRDQRVHSDGASLRPVQWYFDNLLPEEALRSALAKEARVPAEDAFGLLAYFGAESAGSLVLSDCENAAAQERGLKPLPLPELSRRIANLPQSSLGENAPKKMSLAGAQHKLPIVLDGDRLFEPLPRTPSTHILKPNHLLGDHYPASVMNEYFTMRLARESGLVVPNTRRIYVPQPVYIVERFDRIRGNSPDDTHRLHIIDTCQLLNKAPAFKYAAAHLDTLAQAVGLCREKALARQRLYGWLAFNILAGNADNHLKNISFLVDASGIHLAPAYDLLCTAVYDTRAMADERAVWPEVELTIPLERANTFATVARADLIAAGRALGLAEATAQRQLNALLATVPAAAERLIGEIEAASARDAAASPSAETARAYIQGEVRMLRAIHQIVIRDMAERLA
jgi:serine/threonine-protein kinase HipA